jgi:hypothetical protein
MSECNCEKFSKEEVQNLFILVDAGARAISAQKNLGEASGIMGAANQLINKLSKLIPEEKTNSDA